MGNGQGIERALLGGGCFWCLEAAYTRMPGVIRATSGYAGGATARPSYEDVCGGLTGHAEVVAVDYDPSLLSYDAILDLFWKIHDPTTPDRQGADVGNQYRSVIFTMDETQRLIALAAKEAKASQFADPIVTEILPAPAFWPAEDYHQHYFDLHPNAGYCRAVIVPKLRKAGFAR